MPGGRDTEFFTNTWAGGKEGRGDVRATATSFSMVIEDIFMVEWSSFGEVVGELCLWLASSLFELGE